MLHAAAVLATQLRFCVCVSSCVLVCVCSITISTAVPEQSEKEGREGQAVRGEGDRETGRGNGEKGSTKAGKKRGEQVKRGKTWCWSDKEMEVGW